MFDKYKRNIVYARISLTDRCNLRCKYCIPEDGVVKKSCSDILRYSEIDNIISVFSEIGIKKIRFTGGEPLVRKDAPEFIAEMASKYKNIDFYITTNAILLDKYAYLFKKSGIKGINISLDSLDPEIYKRITCGGSLEKALKGLNKVLDAKIDTIKVNAVLSKETSDEDIIGLTNLAKNNKIDVRFIELMPMGDCADYAKEKYLPGKHILEVLPKLELAEGDDPSSPATYYKMPNYLGKIGLINPISCNFCQNCNRIRITSDGFAKPCLHSDTEYNLKPYLDNDDELKKLFIHTIHNKPEKHHLEKQSIKRNMQGIGG